MRISIAMSNSLINVQNVEKFVIGEEENWVKMKLIIYELFNSIFSKRIRIQNTFNILLFLLLSAAYFNLEASRNLTSLTIESHSFQMN